MFSTGQAVDGAVPATAPNAVCGTVATGETMNRSDNLANWTLPANQSCASPIGPKWVASITNWLSFVVDRANIPFHNGANCQQPTTLYNAIISLIRTEINNAFKTCAGGPVSIGDSLVACNELPSATGYVDCEANPIAPGAAIATCADLAAHVTSFNPFTSTAVGAALTVTFYTPEYANSPGATPFVGRIGTLQVSDGTSDGGALTHNKFIETVVDAYAVNGPGSGPDVLSYDIRYQTVGPIAGTWMINSVSLVTAPSPPVGGAIEYTAPNQAQYTVILIRVT